jgi:ABC-type cobalamin/Fe3+-siderophores transport system ATPase subunit
MKRVWTKLMFRATFTIHDQPTMLLDYKRQQELLQAAKAHKGELSLL